MKEGFLEKLTKRLEGFSPGEVQNLVSRLVREKGFLESVFEALREGLLIIDPEGHITFTNTAALRIFGLNPAKTTGQHISTAIRGLDWKTIAKPDRVINRDMEIYYPENLLLNFYLAPINSLVENSDQHLGHVMLIRDITDTKRETEEKLETEKLNALTLLDPGVAHEIGNPLNSLDIHLQLIQRKLKKLPKENQDELSTLLNTAQGEIKRLDTILKQFLHAIRPTIPTRISTQLHQTLKNTIQTLQSELTTRNAQISLNLSDTLPPIEIDPDQIQQALYNTIRNAAQALPPSGGKIEISTTYTDYEISLTIRDNGSGISPEHMGSLYEPYRTTKESGTGLGLLIVRRIIREHGGELEIQSEQNQGTTITIHLPRQQKHPRLLETTQDQSVIELEE